MNIFQQMLTILESPAAEGITKEKREYFRRKIQNHFYSLLYGKFLEYSSNEGLTKAELARRMNKEPAQISRWLANPGNMTINTISDMLIAMDSSIEAELVELSDTVKHLDTQKVTSQSPWNVGTKKLERDHAGLHSMQRIDSGGAIHDYSTQSKSLLSSYSQPNTSGVWLQTAQLHEGARVAPARR